MNNKKKISSEDIQRFRESFETIISYFNHIALNPNEMNQKFMDLMEELPIRWDLQQLYNLIENYYVNHAFSSISFIIVSEDMSILDFIVVSVEFVQENTINGEEVSFLQFTSQFIDDIKVSSEFKKELETDMKKFRSIQIKVNQFLTEYLNIPSTKALILPIEYKEILKKFVPDIHKNVLLTIKEMVELKNMLLYLNKHKNSRMSYIIGSYAYDKFTFDEIKTKISKLENIDFENWARILTTLYDDNLSNLVIVSKKREKILLGIKILTNNHRITINPIPSKYFKDAYIPHAKLIEVAEKIYQKTGVRTHLLDETDVISFLQKSNEPDLDLFDFFAYLMEISLSTTWYPDSLLNSFLKLFGFQLGPGINQFHSAFRTAIQYFENVLIITYQHGNEDKPDWETLVHMHSKNNKSFIKIIESKKFKKIFETYSNDTPESFKKITQEIEKVTGQHFNACYGFNINVLADSLSVKNIQALLSMNNIAHQLPFVATLGGLFAGMKGMKADSKEDPIIQVYDEVPSTDLTIDRMKFASYFDKFLKEGIFFIADEEKSMKEIRSPLFSNNGYLGIDMEALRELISKK